MTSSNIGEEMMGRVKTSVTRRDSEEEEKGESSKKVTSVERVSMSLRGITTITLLKSGAVQEDAFRGFGEKFVLSWSENMNKESTTKDTRRKEIKWLVREEK